MAEGETLGEYYGNDVLDDRWQYGFAPGSKDEQYICKPDPADMQPGESVEDYNLRKGNIYDLDIGNWYDIPNEPSETSDTCDPLYDVDDYARDWADYIGTSKAGGELQLPIIFTIGFGLNFENGSSGTPGTPGYVPGGRDQNVPDALGEELLRYIADVGDNNQVDTDYQQDYLEAEHERGDFEGDFGPRGPCEQPWDPNVAPPGYNGFLPAPMPLPPQQSCGNYYNAPNQAQLQLVFDDIASRMFTRLTG
jgi:hypothetical protein